MTQSRTHWPLISVAMLAVLAGLSFLAVQYVCSLSDTFRAEPNAYLDEISRQGAIALDIRIA